MKPRIHWPRLVELRGLEPLTPTLPVWCATSCATAPDPGSRTGPPRTELAMLQRASQRAARPCGTSACGNHGHAGRKPRNYGVSGPRHPYWKADTPTIKGDAREPQGTGGCRRRRCGPGAEDRRRRPAGACSRRSRAPPPRARRSACLASSPSRSATVPLARAATRPPAQTITIPAANTVKLTAGSALKDAANK